MHVLIHVDVRWQLAICDHASYLIIPENTGVYEVSCLKEIYWITGRDVIHTSATEPT
jgi:hypothetical protein